MKTMNAMRPSRPRFALAGIAVAGVLLGAAFGAWAQDLKDIETPKAPLVLKSRGSFFVGGKTVQQTVNQVSFLPAVLPFPDDQVTVNQMYVEFMVPMGATKTPIVLLHGATLSGKTYDTTPDGRMGWYEHFVREGHPVYVPDQVGRARSGFNQAVFNDVAAGLIAPSSQPHFFRLGDKFGAWTNFRFGPTPGVPYPETKFPVAKAAELSKQDIPDLNVGGLPDPNPTFKALGDLAKKLDGAVLVGHSQSGNFPIEAALTDPRSIKGLVLIEPAGCAGGLVPTRTDAQIALLARIPILVLFGDHLNQDNGTPLPTLWQDSYNGCQAFIARVNAAGGNAQMLWPPALGIIGNSHMIMQDTNNLQIGDMILQWIDRNVRDARSH